MNLICACCSGYAPSRAQWWNQDTGYGVCARCFAWVSAKEGYQQACQHYGYPGQHHSLNVPAPEPPPGMVYTKTELLDGKYVHCYKVSPQPQSA